ncbi:MAG TPA: HAMP domain-containing protein [Thermodesulfobacteriota bacterium]|nr:HAMP domain-containing protein [Thermodesulfobacteriota bacterium]
MRIHGLDTDYAAKKRNKNLESLQVQETMPNLFRLTLAKKILIGYLPLSLLIILISVFVLSTLERLNKINTSIIRTNVPLIEISEKMIDNLLAQELYGRRYAILRSPDILELFRERSREFDLLIERTRNLPDEKNIPIDRIASLHKEYDDLFINGFDYMGRPSSKIGKKYYEGIKKKQEELIGLIKGMSSEAVLDQNEKRLRITNIARKAFQITAVLCIIGIVFGIGTAVLITRNITGPINQLRMATQRISEGRFDQLPKVRNRDELGDLSKAFGEMARRLKSLEEMYLDASPLTRLPGSIAAENVIKKRLDTSSPIAFCLLDIDNFKSFNDRYGYARGNEVIQATAKIIEAAVAKHGASEDFIGHIGGDDFLVVTTPERYEAICSSTIEMFDNKIPHLYDPEDRERGYLIGVTRQGQEVSFPIISLSIAVVTNQKRELKSHLEIGEIAAELKNYAKSISGSKYVVDRRGG